jgi:hypothetical protein
MRVNGEWKCVLALQRVDTWTVSNMCMRTELGWMSDVCYTAAEFGHLECLKYAHENGCGWYGVCGRAATFGQLECLKYAHENGCELDDMVTYFAASTGHLNCLKYAVEHGCQLHVSTGVVAAKAGYLECLKYAHKNGCEWDNV